MWSNNLGHSLGVGGRETVIAPGREPEMMSGKGGKDGHDKLPRCVLAGEDGQALVVGLKEASPGQQRELAGTSERDTRTSATSASHSGGTPAKRSRKQAGEMPRLNSSSDLSKWIFMEGAA